ncbi:DUF4435 domain-containing protein [Vibrio fluvialis]|uniref:DUF4435 domain-containing protein n=1 Tax=Vibrio fluvialis TaxID=676 RepID=UPI00112483D8|nr:DUF4435 domain-containing protein [Vibrio fluvialis]TOY91889.1 hypothetical protein DJ016_18595 [Vibrio fluvialis]TRN10068.1 hypothetical protein DM587_17020 [Vibrio fluvialis]
MHVEKNIPDFEFDDDLEISQGVFGLKPQITAFVEGFDDVYFWDAIFESVGISNVDVESVCCEARANGKSTILKAIKDKRIVLGQFNLICVDSDYDNLLGINQALYESEFCFQTYAYSIENYYYQPQDLLNECRRASLSRTIDCEDIPCLVTLIGTWSKSYFDVFCNHLLANDRDAANQLVSHLTLDGVIECELKCQLSDEQKNSFEQKGLTEDTLHFFIRGHNFESKMSELAKEVTKRLSQKKKDKISNTYSEDTVKASKFIREYIKKQTRVDEFIHGRDFPKNSWCYQKLLSDVRGYKDNYCRI